MILWHETLMGKQYLVNDKLVGKDAAECSALSILGKIFSFPVVFDVYFMLPGGRDLANIGYIDVPVVPCKL
jgi:hypothetical protein